MRDPNTILADIVSKICPVVIVEAVVDNGDGTYEITVCDKFYMQPLFDIVINTVTYPIKSIDGLKITITGTVLPPTGDFNLYKPVFKHGTVMQTNMELSKEEGKLDYTPLIYNLERSPEERPEETESPIEFIADLRLFFLTGVKFDEFRTKDYDESPIPAMRSLIDLFMEQLRIFKGIGVLEDTRVMRFDKFGVETNNKGIEVSLFNSQLSGLEMRIGIPILRLNDCSVC